MTARPHVTPSVLACALALAAVTACSSSGGSGGAAGGGPGGTYSTAAHTTFTMPDLTGKPLPQAEKAVQQAARNALFQIHPEDATPAGRRPEPAQGWKVCGQDIAAGQTTDQTSTLTLRVARLGESCPR